MTECYEIKLGVTATDRPPNRGTRGSHDFVRVQEVESKRPRPELPSSHSVFLDRVCHLLEAFAPSTDPVRICGLTISDSATVRSLSRRESSRQGARSSPHKLLSPRTSPGANFRGAEFPRRSLLSLPARSYHYPIRDSTRTPLPVRCTSITSSRRHGAPPWGSRSLRSRPLHDDARAS